MSYPDHRKDIGPMALDRFFDRYRKSGGGLAQYAALKHVQNLFPLNSAVTDEFIYIMKSLDEARFTDCANYMKSIILIDSVEKHMGTFLSGFRHFDNERDLLRDELPVKTPLSLDLEYAKIAVWALCLDIAPNAEEFAKARLKENLLPGVTYGMMLDYRRQRFTEPVDLSAENEALHFVTQALKSNTRKRPLKRGGM